MKSISFVTPLLTVIENWKINIDSLAFFSFSSFFGNDKIGSSTFLVFFFFGIIRKIVLFIFLGKLGYWDWRKSFFSLLSLLRYQIASFCVDGTWILIFRRCLKEFFVVFLKYERNFVLKLNFKSKLIAEFYKIWKNFKTSINPCAICDKSLLICLKIPDLFSFLF